MGSRSTKVAAPPHVKAVASPVAPAQQHHVKSNDTNELGPCQAHVRQATGATVISPRSFDDINIKPSTQIAIALQRRYSEPVQTAAMATEVNTNGVRYLDAFESYIAARNLMAINMDDADLISPVPIEPLPVSAPFVPTEKEPENSQTTEEPEVRCIGCCTQLPKEKDPKYAHEVISPCRSCNSTYCVECVKGMFLKACKDSTRMPPRCCVQIHLHHIKPHLTAEEISEYRSKYEEWSTPKPFYCPKLTCSAFVPERLLPQQTGSKGKRKADSGIGTPTSSNIQCPKCEGEICVDCRQVAHPGRLCASLDLGVDAETAALLKAWGYKRCPKCSQGLKRMYGCNHMECRCGAHFCWGCLRSRDDCEGGCYEGGDEDEDYGSDSEPDEPEPLPAQDDHIDTAMTDDQMVTEEGISPITQAPAEVASDITTTPQTAPRLRNLDGGSARYWEDQDLHFGDEPDDDIQDRVWDCYHSFEPYTIPLASSIFQHSSAHELECVKCWSAIRPAIDTPRKPASVPVKTARIPLSERGNGVISGRVRAVNAPRGRGRPMVAILRPAAYVPPRGLFHSDATVGTAPHLTAQIHPAGLRDTATQAEVMEGVRSEADLDAATNIEELEPVPASQLRKTTATISSTSNVFIDAAMTYSTAQECENCRLLVCQKCVDDILDQREAESEAREEERVAAEAEEELRTEEEMSEQREVPVPASQVEQNSPLLFD